MWNYRVFEHCCSWVYFEETCASLTCLLLPLAKQYGTQQQWMRVLPTSLGASQWWMWNGLLSWFQFISLWLQMKLSNFSYDYGHGCLLPGKMPVCVFLLIFLLACNSLSSQQNSLYVLGNNSVIHVVSIFLSLWLAFCLYDVIWCTDAL